jgi:hypothetical protein
MSEPVQPSPLDRLLTAIRAIIRAEFPQYTYAGLYSYTIQSINSGTGAIDAEPVDTTVPLPGLSNISLSPSLLGDLALATSGSTCLVEFVNADPTRPVVISIGATNFTGTVDASQQMNIGPSASTVNLGAAAMPVARISDTVAVYFPMGTSITIVGVALPPTPGAVSASLQFITDPISNTPLPCAGIIGSGSTVSFS